MGRSSNFNGQKNYVRYCQRVFPKNILKLYIPIFVASIPINPSISMTPRHYCYAIPYDDFGNPDWTAPWQDMVPMRCWNGQWCSMVLEIAGIITSNNWGVWIYMVYWVKIWDNVGKTLLKTVFGLMSIHTCRCSSTMEHMGTWACMSITLL